MQICDMTEICLLNKSVNHCVRSSTTLNKTQQEDKDRDRDGVSYPVPVG